MARPRYKFMDMLLLTAPSPDPWRLRSVFAIEEAIKREFRGRIQISELVGLRFVAFAMLMAHNFVAFMVQSS